MNTDELKGHIPQVVLETLTTLKNGGFEGYLIGGCVRDLVLHKKPKDWDITTNAKPEQIQGLYSHTYYENTYGTVGVIMGEHVQDDTLKVIEITPYRLESEYTDRRRPDEVIFSDKLEDDLKRRDFTINALALDVNKGQITDLYKGQQDIKDKTLQTVGDAHKRFSEDALRMLRAVRLSCELGFTINPQTEKAIVENSHLLSHISTERIRDEFIRILMSDQPKAGIELARKVGILRYISPDIETGIDVHQGGAHSYDVWEHLLRSLQHTADKKWPLEIRLAALYHDIGKPKTHRPGQFKPTFYGHEVVGAKMAKKVLTDLKFPQKTVELVTKLIRWHMFFSDTEEISLSAVRRLIANVGKEHIWELMDVRIADRVGTGRPKEEPYRLRKFQSMIEQVMTDPISVGMLKIDGKGIMEATGEKPGPKIGFTLHVLLEEVIEDPKLNTEEYLAIRAKELILLDEKKLKTLGEKGKEAKAQEAEKQVGEIRKKYHVE